MVGGQGKGVLVCGGGEARFEELAVVGEAEFLHANCPAREVCGQ